MPTNGQCGGNYPVYRSYYSDQIADANHRFTVDLTAHVRMNTRRGDILEGIVMCAPVTDEEREADVVRFLEQATLGPTEALVAEVKAKGIEKWLDEQLAMNVTRYTQLPYAQRIADPSICGDDMTPPVTPEKYCNFNTQQSWPVAMEFFRQSRNAPDQLRLRMAHNWHEIFVAQDAQTYAFAEFHMQASCATSRCSSKDVRRPGSSDRYSTSAKGATTRTAARRASIKCCWTNSRARSKHFRTQ